MWEFGRELKGLEKPAKDRESRVSEVKEPLEVSQVTHCT